MEDKLNEGARPKINRRNFVGALGAAAAAGAFLQRAKPANAAPSQVYYYQDSFENIVPAGEGVIDIGLYPPPVPAASAPANAANPDAHPLTAGSTGYSSGYPIYNILLIVVDQMRNPAFWLPSGNNWISTYGSIMPRITALANQSFAFPNYFVAATVCTPSRACMLTGLYSQQTCIFQTGSGDVTPPPLLPYNSSWSEAGNAAGFPTIGNVLSQQLNLTSGNSAYNCAWIGKWHLSCLSGESDGLPGQNGPSDFGFNSTYNLPTANNSNPYPGGNDAGRGYPSPNGQLNGGTGGDFLDSLTQNSSARDVPNWSPTLQYNNNGTLEYVMPQNNYTQLNDAAIASAFTNYWLPYANNHLSSGNVSAGSQLSTPWFCAVSLINPHDISDFPWPFDITSNNNSSLFVTPVKPGTQGYQPPPLDYTSNNTYYGTDCYSANNNNGCAVEGDVTTIMAFPSPYSGLPPGTGNNGHWNFESLTTGKPGLQQVFLEYLDSQAGKIQVPGTYNTSNNTWPQPTAWTEFLNYYAWLQSCVDYQVGQVLGTNTGSGTTTAGGLQQNTTFWENTVIIFTSDHGDFGGSHGLHAKGGALYDEVLNVPLFISYPPSRINDQANPIVLPYLCSSVDLLPFLYTLALGNQSWRSNNNDMVFYLAGREAIADPIYQYSTNNTSPIAHRRISGISLNNSFGGNNWQVYQPFVLHTTDEFSIADLGNNADHNYQPSHAIAFRTLDQTETSNNAAPFAGQTSYGGGKLGVYSFWDTCDASSAPIIGIGFGSNSQCEFYNYSPSRGYANPQEMSNQFLNNSNISTLALPYYNDFNNSGNNNGINIQTELYQLNTQGSTGTPVQQVQAAIQTAFSNYILYLGCSSNMTGNNGQPDDCTTPGCNDGVPPYTAE